MAAYCNGRVRTAIDMPNRTRSSYVRAILVDSDWRLWFGTRGAGVTRLSDEACGVRRPLIPAPACRTPTCMVSRSRKVAMTTDDLGSPTLVRVYTATAL